jgi:prepilin-type N-terminal cleavage/methylation domain-containing protein/prepilin-type processing-associated H-X9-DG protein
MGQYRETKGFSLLEILIVIGLITVLMGILLPAVQSARESMRRLACANNLRQLGLAVQNYEGAFRVLPVSIGPWAEGVGWPQERNGKGWLVSILPQIEQAVLFDQFEPAFRGNFFTGGGLRSDRGLELMKVQFSIFRCPSEGSNQGLSTSQFYFERLPVAITNYKGVLGDNSVKQSVGDECYRRGDCNGLFYRTSYQRPPKMTHVSDGTSHTSMIGEDIAKYNDHSAAFFANSDWCSCEQRLNYMPQPPQPMNWAKVMSFRSHHANGANFCMVDGSIRFVDENVNHMIYRDMCTKNGGEVPFE